MSAFLDDDWCAGCGANIENANETGQLKTRPKNESTREIAPLLPETGLRQDASISGSKEPNIAKSRAGIHPGL